MLLLAVVGDVVASEKTGFGVDEGFKQSVLAACLMVFVVAYGCRW